MVSVQKKDQCLSRLDPSSTGAFFSAIFISLLEVKRRTCKGFNFVFLESF